MSKKIYTEPCLCMLKYDLDDVLTSSIEDADSVIKDSYDWLEGVL